MLASDEPEYEVVDGVKRINHELTLIAHQEDVADHVLETYGYDVNKLRVLSPNELITLYTCEENLAATEYDFKKALDLLEYVESEDERPMLKLRIWARAARRDRWDTVSENPEQQIKNTVFFKLMDLVFDLGMQKIPTNFMRVCENIPKSQLKSK